MSDLRLYRRNHGAHSLLARTCRGRRVAWAGVTLFILVFCPRFTAAQPSVVTAHSDVARTGQNTNETILTPANVNQGQFGKLFSYAVDGYVYAQPLYLPGVNIPGRGTYNALFLATEHDSVYAFDADSTTMLWQATLLDATHGAAPGATTVPNSDVNSGDIVPEIGITGTPVIDPATGTLYVVGRTKENGRYVQRLHALDITTGAERIEFNSPVELQASVPGSGSGSSGGTLPWDPRLENQRAGLLLLNGIVYVGFGSHSDTLPYHGWILAYSATSLQQTGAFCSTPNGSASGIWMAGSGLAADVVDPVNQPYGRLFIATGNGSFDAAPPYSNSMDYGDDLVRLDLTNGVPTVTDSFTPFNQQSLAANDEDTGSGGVLVLPDQTGGGPQHLLIQAGKEGRIFLVDRDNMGGYNPSQDAIVQEIPAAPATTGYQIGGVWGMPAYWNGNVYFWASQDSLKAFSFTNGFLSPTPTSQSAEVSGFPGPMLTVSANGNANGIVWTIESSAQGSAILMAHDALNVATLLYSSNQNPSRDDPGPAVKFAVPTVANGKVYVGAAYQVSVFGGLSGPQPQQTPTPVFSPGSETFTSSVQVTITDDPRATIYYTTDGSTPTTSSTQYTGPVTVTTTETINAMATAPGFTPSAVASATYTRQQQPQQTPAPVFSPGSETFSSSIQVTITDDPGATIYYTTDGSTPTTSSTQYTGSITVTTTETINAMATAPGFTPSAVASATYTLIQPQTAPPTFSPGGGTYLLPQRVTISDASPGAAIYYTTDGSAPTTSSTQYTGPFLVLTTTTVRAIAVVPGWSPSSVASASYFVLL